MYVNVCSTGGGISSLSPSSRDAVVDPIAELLSQLSGVRRGAGQPGTPSQLQQLQMQLQLERQQATVRPSPLLFIILYHTVSDIVSINVQSNFINYSLIIDRRLDNSWSDCRGAQAERPAEPAAARPRPRHSLP